MRSSNQPKVRYAVVGLGHLAQVAVLPAFARSQNSELCALVSSDTTKLSKLGRKYKVRKLGDYEQFEECIAGVDAVYIVLPNHLHREFTVRALQAGVHVLCEKPMAVNEEECREMIREAEENRKKLMIAYRLHFEEGNLFAIETAQKGKLGELRIFTSEFAQQVAPGNIRLEAISRGGGPVYDMGVYCINAARYLFADEPHYIMAHAFRSNELRFAKSEEMAAVTMRFPGERVATFVVSFGAADISRYTLIGAEGVLTADPAYEYAEGIKLQVQRGDKLRKRNFPKRDQFAAEITYFSDCIQRNLEPEPSGWEGLADVRIVEAIYASIRSQREVMISPITKRQRPGMRQEIRRPPHGKPQSVHATSPSGEAA